MYLSLTDEQQFLREAAEGALSRIKTVEAARAVLDGEPPLDLWSAVAVDAGWPGLLVGEAADGAGLGAYEAMLVLEACGRVLADARLLGHLPATALLDAAGSDAEVLGALARGERRAALADPALTEHDVAVTAEGGALHGTLRAVVDAAGADVLVVVAQHGDGTPAAYVVEAGADGVRVEAERAYDGTRALAEVVLDGAAGLALAVTPEQVDEARALQRVLLAAESVGAAEGAMTMARDYAVDRHAFGRAIGSYQAIKHKVVEMLRRTEGARSLLVQAGRAWERDRAAFPLAANAACVAAADALDHAAPENIFIHGGVGATWEHDAMLFYRRAETSRRLAGGAEAAAVAVAELLLAGSPAQVEQQTVALR